MKAKTLLLLALLAALLCSPQANALSCIKTYPRIATVDSIGLSTDNSLKIILKWVYSFDASQITSSPTIKVDDYLPFLSSYIADELDEFIDLEEEETSWNFSQIDIESVLSSRLNVDVGDIIITSPPTHICTDSVMAVFSSEGQAKQILHRGDFLGYSFHGQSLNVQAGKEIECQGYSCQVKTTFAQGEKEFDLVPGQELELSGSVFSKIFLKSSKAPEEGVDAKSIFPWGGGRLTEYLLDLSSVAPIEQPDEDSDEAGENGEAVEPELQDEENGNSEAEGGGEIEGEMIDRPNIFSRFFSWLKSLFN